MVLSNMLMGVRSLSDSMAQTGEDLPSGKLGFGWLPEIALHVMHYDPKVLYFMPLSSIFVAQEEYVTSWEL